MVLRTTVAFRVCATVAGAVAMALVYGVDDGALIAVLMLLMGIPVLTVAHLIARHRRRFARLSWQIVQRRQVLADADFDDPGHRLAVLFDADRAQEAAGRHGHRRAERARPAERVRQTDRPDRGRRPLGVPCSRTPHAPELPNRDRLVTHCGRSPWPVAVAVTTCPLPGRKQRVRHRRVDQGDAPLPCAAPRPLP